MTDKQIKAILKDKGAAEHFGLRQSTLDTYIKRGKYPLTLIQRVLDEQKEGAFPPEAVPMPPDAPEVVSGVPEVMRKPQPQPQPHGTGVPLVEKRVEDIVKYLQTTVDFYIKQFAARITNIERTCAALSAAHLRASGAPSLTRPDQNVPVEQTFTTNPLGNSLDTGVAPTKAMVDAQANMTTLEGVPIPGAQVAHPAEFIPDLPSYGFGWNKPRERR